MKKITLFILAGAAVLGMWFVPWAQAQDVDFTGGGADLTFYYESTGAGTGTWFSVFRAKGTAGQPTTATATNLTSPFTGFTGIAGNQVPAVAGNTGDYNFGTLTVTAVTVGTATIGSTTFHTLSASGSPFNPSVPTADLGIRTRFQSQSTNQFPGGMRLTLDLVGSSFNGNTLGTSGAYVSLLHWDSFNNPVALINSDGGSLEADFAMSGHVHRNWGFSQAGDYQLAFTMSGLGGTGDYAGVPAGSTVVNFSVVPEPSTGILLLAGLGVAWLLRKRVSCAWISRKNSCVLRVVALVAVGLLGSGSARSMAEEPLPYTQGHMDVGVRLVGGVLVGFWKNDGATVNNQVTFQNYGAGEIAATGIFDDVTLPPLRPAGSQWDFLGVAAGEPVYIFPSSGVPVTLPYLGFSTEDPSLGIFEDVVTISLVDMVGPSGSTFALYTSSSNVPMTGTPLGSNGSISMEVGDHGHYNWSFSHLGSYELTFDFLAIDPDDEEYFGTTTFAFEIIPEPSSLGMLLAAGFVFFLGRRSKLGCAIRLQ